MLARGTRPALGLKTMPVLSHKMWGIQPDRMTVVGARTSQGKSCFAVQIAIDLAEQGHPVIVYSLEMSVEENIERMFCNRKKINNRDLMSGKFTNYGKEWQDFFDYVYELPLAITDSIGFTWEDVDRSIENLTTKPKVIVIDYVQATKSQGMNQKDKMDDYIMHIREMGIRRHFAVVVCSQVNRESQGAAKDQKEPMLHHLKGTGVLEEHSDAVILLHRPYVYNTDAPEDLCKIIVAKNRNGPTGYLNMRFTPSMSLFEDWEEDTYARATEEINSSI